MADTINPFATGNTYVDPNAETDAQFKQKQLDAATWGGSSNSMGTLDPVDIAATKNGQDINSLVNANSPTPLLQAGNPSVIDTILNMGAREPAQMMNNAKAVSKGAPLDPLEPLDSIQPTVGYKSILPPAVSEPVPQAAAGTPINTDAIVNAGSAGIVNPLAGSQALAISGIKDAADAGYKKSVADHAYYQGKADLEQKAADDQELLHNRFELKYQEQMDTYTSTIKEFKDLAGQKVVPGALLARQDTSAALSTGISVALGAMAGALNGTNQNIGLEMINKAIDRDVASQQFNLDQAVKIKGTDVTNQQNMLSIMRTKFGDDKSAIAATKAGMLALVEDKMNALLTKDGGSRDIAIRGQAKMAVSEIIKQKEIMEYQLKAAQATQFQQQQQLMGKDKYNLSPEDAILAHGPDMAQQYVSGFGLARSTKDKQKFQEVYGDSKDSLQALNSIINTDVNRLSYNDRAKLGTELALITGKMRLAILGPGAMTEQEYDRLRETLGDPTKVFTMPGTQKLKLQTTFNRLQAQQDNLTSLYFGKDRLRELKASSVKNLMTEIKK